jgi:hypothetical protein
MRKAFTSLRSVSDFLVNKVALGLENREKARRASVSSGFTTLYWQPTAANIRRALEMVYVEKKIDPFMPMHHAGFLESDPLTSVLSAFGPLVPSPHIPGGQEIRDFSKVPNQSQCCFRRCGLTSAVQEWKEFLEKGIVRNEPKNLNARFQYAQMRGLDAKKEWYELMGWAKGLGKPDTMDENLQGDEGDDDGGVMLARGGDDVDDVFADF